MIFSHCSLVQEGEAILFYYFDRQLNGYMIAGVIVGSSVQAKMQFAKVWKYFVSAVVQADDIYCSIPLDAQNSLFENYVTFHTDIKGFKVYKVDSFLKKQYSTYEQHLESVAAAE